MNLLDELRTAATNARSDRRVIGIESERVFLKSVLGNWCSFNCLEKSMQLEMRLALTLSLSPRRGNLPLPLRL
jgi:hypothetical protein